MTCYRENLICAESSKSRKLGKVASILKKKEKKNNSEKVTIYKGVTD